MKKSRLGRGAPLVTRTELARKTELKRTAFRSATPVPPLDGAHPSSSGPTKAKKRAHVSRQERSAKKIVRTRSGGLCEIRIPDVCLGPYLELSHRWADGQCGLWVPSNGLASCGWAGCHGWLHRNPAEAKRQGWMIAPQYTRDESGRQVPVPTTAVPAFIWSPQWEGQRWKLLDDLGGYIDLTAEEAPQCAS